ncbi:MAG: thymidine phosphorylase [Fimbriimonadaceae bacterium]|nr:thymidine phosphorylase [Fimbriimonadaceae bacterium]
MNFLDIISRKRDGQAHSLAELTEIAQGAASGDVPDYQLSAWLMAAFLNGMNTQETADLTRAMAESGDRVDLTGLEKPWVDKHSTGGVGDKTTLVLLPLLAACGLTVVKMSGRGLGITGGTVDKLESLPGMRLDLSPEEMKEQAARIGLALTGQTPRLAPADKALYALRDVTGTVANIPLITASILSKKIAGGAEVVVLDVKCGTGAFMRSLADANALKASLENVGEAAGLRVRAVVTDMDQPLGGAVGNALEVREAWRVLTPGTKLTPAELRFRGLVLGLASMTLGAAEVSGDPVRALDSGDALEKANDWLRAQGAAPSTLLQNWAAAPVVVPVPSPGGWLARLDARACGEIALDLGAGRRTKEDRIDHRVGLEIHAPVGTKFSAGETFVTVHAADEAAADRAVAVLTTEGEDTAVRWSKRAIATKPMILE